MNKEFYDRCAELLGTTHEYHDPVPRRTRWNTRLLGNGRFPGRGVIRPYNANCIHAMLTNPRIVRTFTSVDALFEFLETLPPLE